MLGEQLLGLEGVEVYIDRDGAWMAFGGDLLQH